MEAAPKQEQVTQNIDDVDTLLDEVKAQYGRLKQFEEGEIRGREAARQVEEIAKDLHFKLIEIDPAVRREHGLPWHPLEDLTVANDDNFVVAA